MKDKLSPINMKVVALLVFLTFLLITYVFYNSDGRNRVEDYFFDLRTRLDLVDRPISNVLLIAINDQSIRRIETNKRGDLSTEKLIEIVQRIGRMNPKAVLIVDWQHIFSRTERSQNQIINLLKKDSRVHLGSFGYDTEYPWPSLLPLEFAEVKEQVMGVGGFKPRSNSILRKLPYRAYRGFESRYLAPAGIAEALRSDFRSLGDSFYLNFVAEKDFPTINSAEIFFNDNKNLKNFVSNKVVVIGYTSYRTVEYQTTDQMKWNTPLEGNPNNYLHGASSSYISALALENLLNDTFLKHLPSWATILQTLVMTLICFFSWYWGVLFAVSLVCMSWVCLIVFHVWLFESQSLFLPIADTFLFSSGALLLGALLRLGSDIRQLAFVRVRLESKKTLALVQGRFLDRFSVELSKMNDRILSYFNKMIPAEDSASYQDIIVRAQVSCQELGAYLDDIGLLSQVETRGLESPKLETFELKPVIDLVVRSLDAQAEQKSININFLCDQDVYAYSNEKIVDTILFNFISNAIKYSPNNTNVEVRCFRSKHSRKLVIVSVTDRGPGISEEYQDKIFEKFYRIKNDDVYRIKGTGLGLYLCKFFSDKIKAKIFLDSEVGKGSTFSLELRGGK